MADTQGENASIFRQSAMNRIASADDLDKYMRVTNPSAWVVLLAAILLIGGLAIWSATAVIPTTVQVTGVAMGKEVTCWVDEKTEAKIEEGGAYATVMDVEASKITLDDIPYSEAEVRNDFESDYLVESVTLHDWNYELNLTMPKPIEGTAEDDARPVPVNITVSETHPLNLVLGNR